MIELGNHIRILKTGIIGTCGTVVGILDSVWYLFKNPGDHSHWDKLYPRWTDKPVLIIKYDEPQRSISFNEYYNLQTEIKMTREVALYLYEKFVYVVEYVAVPYDDVEAL